MLRAYDHTLLKLVTNTLPNCPGVLYAQQRGLVH